MAREKVSDVGAYKLRLDLPATSAGLRVVVTQVSPWPKGPCLRYVLTRTVGTQTMEKIGGLDGGEWLDPRGVPVTTLTLLEIRHPGEAATDQAGKILCVPLDARRSLVRDETAAEVARAVAKSLDELAAEPNGRWAVLRRVVPVETATLVVEVLQPIDGLVALEAV